MPRDNDQADALRLYLTGASSDGGTQTDPDASLGNYRSSTQIMAVGHLVRNAIPGLTIDYVCPRNGLGEGAILSDGSAIAWLPPGGTRGDYVTIANGETKIAQGGGGDPGKYIRVSRTSADSLDGASTVKIVDVFNALFDNVGNAERAAGDLEYRCFAFKAGPYATIRDFKLWLGLLGTANTVDSSGYAATGAVTVTGQSSFGDWLESGYVKNTDTGEVMYYSSRTATALTVPAGGRDVWGDGAAAGSEDDALEPISGVRIGIESPSSQPSGSFTTVADEDTAPGGVTFEHPTSTDDVDVLISSMLTAGQIQGLWVERAVVSGAAATPRARILIEWTFTTAG